MPRAGLTRERLVVTGAELADEVGFEAVTLAELARRHGVRTASLYAHIRDSADLRTRIALLALAELADRAAEGVLGRSGRDALQGFAAAYRDYARQHPGRYTAARLRLPPELAAAGAGPRHADLARALLRGYRVPESEQAHAIRMIGALLHGYLSLELAGDFEHSEPDPETSWQRCLDALDRVLDDWPMIGSGADRTDLIKEDR